MRNACVGKACIVGEYVGKITRSEYTRFGDQKYRGDMGYIFPEKTRRDSRFLVLQPPSRLDHTRWKNIWVPSSQLRLVTAVSFWLRIRAASLRRHWSEQMARACMRWRILSEEFSTKMYMNNVQNEIRIPTRFIPVFLFEHAVSLKSHAIFSFYTNRSSYQFNCYICFNLFNLIEKQ